MNLDLYSLEVFCRVIEDGTFSGAAKTMRLSQPTVSQQIAKLESRLNHRLFQRVGHDVVPTPQAHDLYRFAHPLLEQVDTFEETLAQNQTAPQGIVRYAMPESCQWTPHFRRVMAEMANHPGIQLRIQVLMYEEILQKLLEGQLDFGFVVGDRVSPDLRFESFCNELYSAVAARPTCFAGLKTAGIPKDFRLITYPGWEPFFTAWAKAHGQWARLRSKLNEPLIHIGTLAGAIHAVQEGAGVAVIPTHCVLNELETRRMAEWKPKPVIAQSPVYLAKRLGEKLPRRVELVIDILKKAKAGESRDV